MIESDVVQTTSLSSIHGPAQLPPRVALYPVSMWSRRRTRGDVQQPPSFWWAFSRPILFSDPVLILLLVCGLPLWILTNLFERGVRHAP